MPLLYLLPLPVTSSNNHYLFLLLVSSWSTCPFGSGDFLKKNLDTCHHVQERLLWDPKFKISFCSDAFSLGARPQRAWDNFAGNPKITTSFFFPHIFKGYTRKKMFSKIFILPIVLWSKRKIFTNFQQNINFTGLRDFLQMKILPLVRLICARQYAILAFFKELIS